MINILFMGTKKFGDLAFLKLVKDLDPSIYRIKIAVSHGPEVNWWGTHSTYNYCIENNVFFISNSERNEDLIFLNMKKFNINMIICCQHIWILPPHFIKFVNHNSFNFHNSLLPNYKGYFAINNAILNYEERYTTSLHFLTNKVDSGAIIDEISFPIDNKVTAFELYELSIIKQMELLGKMIHRLNLREVIIPKRVISSSGVFYSKKETQKKREVKSFDELSVKSRAFFFPPFEPAYIMSNYNKLYLIPEDFLEGQNNFK